MNNHDLALVLAFYKTVFSDFSSHDPSQRLCNRSNVRYAVRRIRHEGTEFVSKSLPLLGKACEASLVSGEPFQVPTTFALHWRSKLPSFMYNYFVQLFDDSGSPRDATSGQAYAYWVVRQVCLAYSKATDIPSRMTEEEAIKSFSSRITEEPVITAPSWLLNRARRLIQAVVMDGDSLNPSLAQWDTDPYGRHGPGAVAQKETGLSKWNFGAVEGLNKLLYKFNDLSLPPKGKATPIARVVCVPKDFKSLRTICVEPKEFQFGQQGLWTVLRYIIHQHPLTRRSINFDDQTLNMRACKDPNVATIDLKDASDRVSLKLCRLLFPKEFFRLVTRYRSRGLSVNGQVLKPTCYASMGSALCFPIETLVFWAIARASIHPETRNKTLRVFGDDIVCPKEDARFIIKALESCGLVVNKLKTCIDTPIRESCGAYFYKEVDVRVVRFQNSRCESVPAWTALISNCQQLFDHQLSRTSYAMLLHLKDYWHVPFGFFGLPKSPDGYSCQSRWNADLQRTEWRLPCLVQTEREKGRVRDSRALLYAWLIGNSTKPRLHGPARVKVNWAANGMLDA